jgi:hypothetical protein
MLRIWMLRWVRTRSRSRSFWVSPILNSLDQSFVRVGTVRSGGLSATAFLHGAEKQFEMFVETEKIIQVPSPSLCDV